MAKKKAQPLTEAEKAYGRTTTRVQIAAAVWAQWERLREADDVDQQWLAERLGKDKGRISRLLKGPGNWTVDTVADLLEAMGARVTKVETTLYSELAARAAPAEAKAGESTAESIGALPEAEWPGLKISDVAPFAFETSPNDNDWEDGEPYLLSASPSGARRTYEVVHG